MNEPYGRPRPVTANSCAGRATADSAITSRQQSASGWSPTAVGTRRQVLSLDINKARCECRNFGHATHRAALWENWRCRAQPHVTWFAARWNIPSPRFWAHVGDTSSFVALLISGVCPSSQLRLSSPQVQGSVQSRTVESDPPEPVARVLPPGPNANGSTTAVWPVRVVTVRPVAASHSRTVPS